MNISKLSERKHSQSIMGSSNIVRKDGDVFSHFLMVTFR